MTQNDEILAHLKRGEGITPKGAYERYGCLRLAARIYDLRNRGHVIDAIPCKENGKQFAKYRLAS